MLVSPQITLTFTAGLCLAALACDATLASEEPPVQLQATPQAPAAPTPTAPSKPKAGAPTAVARKVFTQKCVVCHGKTGDGDGPGAAALDPKPRAFKDPQWQKSVTDDHLKTIILKGGTAVGKSPVMPGNPELKGKDDVIEELVRVIRAFKS